MVGGILLGFLQLQLLFRSCLSESVITVQDEFGLGPVDPEIADELDWTRHSCRRECTDHGPALTCYYTFKVESYHTMSKACYDCPLNRTDCFLPHCVPADGVKRPILVVNRQMPGPSIEVCQGDRVIVDIVNLLHSESTTMHWHGQHHLRTPYMDGVPYVSQCPILPGASFRYEYVATEAGTHFWHSHLGFQRADGAFGPLIVRVPPKNNGHSRLYELDRHAILIMDWTHELGLDKFLAHHHNDGDNKPPNLLINGLGRWMEETTAVGEETEREVLASATMPLATFEVKQNLRYRFRLINAEFLNCPVEVSIDNHTLLVISSDGRDIEPIQAESLVSYAGERFDFVVEANQEPKNYWIRFRGLMDCDERFTKAHQAAVLRYKGAPVQDPEGPVTYEREPNPDLGVRVNALNEGTESNRSVSVPLFRALDEDDPAVTAQPDYQFYVSYDFYKKDNPHFHRKNYYGFRQVKNRLQRVLTPQLNHISMKLPPSPLLSQRESVDSNKFCNETTVHGCEEDYCACTHVLQVKLGAVVEVVLVDEGFAYDANHPFHLHGYQFRVVAMKRVGRNVTADEVKLLDREGLIQRNLDHAPLKDTVTVPDGGYTVIRFHANNPGYWLFHCHIEFHAEVGMSLVFKVGEHEEMPPVPENFPTCGDWRQVDRPVYETTKRSIETETTTVWSTQSPNSRVNKTEESGIDKILKLLPELMKALRAANSSTPSASAPSCLLIASLSLIASCVIFNA